MNTYLCLNKIEKGGNTSLGRLFDLDGAAADGAHRLTHKVYIYLGGVFLNRQSNM